MVRKLFLTPPSLPGESQCRSISIPSSREWLGIFNKAILETCQWWNYEQVNETDLTPEEVAATCYNLFVGWLTNEGCEIMDVRQNGTDPCTLEKSSDGGATWTPFADLQLCPPLIRVGENGRIQVSSDGGVTWTDAQAVTPNPITPPAGQESKCLSARNAAEVYRLTWEQAYAEWTGGGLLMLGIAAFIATLATAVFFPPAVPAVWTFFVLLYEAAQTLTGGEWTTTVTDDLTEIFYCNMTATGDGTVTLDWTQTITDITALGGGSNVIYDVILYIANIVGQSGTEQAAATRSITAYDCTGYPCAADIIIVASDRTGGSIALTPSITIEQLDATHWRVTSVFDDPYQKINIEDAAGRPFQLTVTKREPFNVTNFNWQIYTDSWQAVGGVQETACARVQSFQTAQGASEFCVWEFSVTGCTI